jgi:hypothetical protein
MKKIFFIFNLIILLSSCHTEIKKPDYKFMNKIKQLSFLDSSLKTDLVISPQKQYFGNIKNGEEVKGKFWIKNIGKIDFIFYSLKPDCDCISIEYSKTQALKPNDSLKVLYKLNNVETQGIFSHTIVAVGNCQFGNQTFYFEGTIF